MAADQAGQHNLTSICHRWVAMVSRANTECRTTDMMAMVMARAWVMVAMEQGWVIVEWTHTECHQHLAQSDYK